jgi:anti-sigma B factor antagonist
MIVMETGWTLEVERGPDWLFIKLGCDADAAHDASGYDTEGLAERIWSLYEQHFARRLVLECDRIKLMHSRVLAELIAVHRRVTRQGGVMRLCGLSPLNQQVLHTAHLDNYLHSYATRAEAVLIGRPAKPR